VAGSNADNTLLADLSCPDGGSVSVTLSTEPSSELIYGEYRDKFAYNVCTVDGATYNGVTAEQNSIFPETAAESVSRRFGGFVYSGSSNGSNQFTNHPEGFGDVSEQFTVSNSRGVTAILYAQQSYVYSSSSRDYPLQRWHGNWRLEHDDRILTIEKMNIRASNGPEPVSLAIRTIVEPYFSITGNVTNGRTISATNQRPVIEMVEAGSLRFGFQNFTDVDGGILNLYFDLEGLQQTGVSSNAIRIDTEGQILNQLLPLEDEMFQLTGIL